MTVDTATDGMQSAGMQTGPSHRKPDDQCFAYCIWAFDDKLPSGAQREDMAKHTHRLRKTLVDLKKLRRADMSNELKRLKSI